MEEPKLILEDDAHARKVWCTECNPAFSIYMTELGPGGRVPLHRLVGQSAILHMARGERLVTVGNERTLLEEGEMVVVPAYGYTGIEDPQEAVDDGPCRFWTTYVLVDPPLDLPDLGLRRIVAVRRDHADRITHFRLDDGRTLDMATAVEEAEAGRIRDVHVVRLRAAPPRLRVHHSLKKIFSLEDLPTF